MNVGEAAAEPVNGAELRDGSFIVVGFDEEQSPIGWLISDTWTEVER